MKMFRMHHQYRIRLAQMARWAMALLLAASLSLSPGCKQNGSDGAAASTHLSPEEEATLAQLTKELHRTMVRQKLSGSFEEFAAARNDLTIPPPPAGKKYAITKKWKVIVVDR